MIKFIMSTGISLMLVLGCTQSPTQPLPGEPRELSEVYNVIWELESYDVDGLPADLNRTSPFLLVFQGNNFLGNDGCNSYGGRYRQSGQNISTSDLVATEIACFAPVFPMDQLDGELDLQITDRFLKLSRPGAEMVFFSNTSDNITGSPLTANSWLATASNAPEFDLLESLNLLPTIEFDRQRGFRATWWCSEDNIFDCNQQFGFWGAGGDNRIRIWHTGGSYARATGADAGEDNIFLERIFNADHYLVSGNSLRLSDSEAGLFFDFQAVSGRPVE